MRDCPKTNRHTNSLRATIPGPKPGDFEAGSVQSRAAARAMVESHAKEQRSEEDRELEDLTEFEIATTEDVPNPQVRVWMIRLLRVAQERAKVYEQELRLPTPEEIRRRRAVGKEFDRMTPDR